MAFDEFRNADEVQDRDEETARRPIRRPEPPLIGDGEGDDEEDDEPSEVSEPRTDMIREEDYEGADIGEMIPDSRRDPEKLPDPLPPEWRDTVETNEPTERSADLHEELQQALVREISNAVAGDINDAMWDQLGRSWNPATSSVLHDIAGDLEAITPAIAGTVVEEILGEAVRQPIGAIVGHMLGATVEFGISLIAPPLGQIATALRLFDVAGALLSGGLEAVADCASTKDLLRTGTHEVTRHAIRCALEEHHHADRAQADQLDAEREQIRRLIEEGIQGGRQHQVLLQTPPTPQPVERPQPDASPTAPSVGVMAGPIALGGDAGTEDEQIEIAPTTGRPSTTAPGGSPISRLIPLDQQRTKPEPDHTAADIDDDEILELPTPAQARSQPDPEAGYPDASAAGPPVDSPHPSRRDVEPPGHWG